MRTVCSILLLIISGTGLLFFGCAKHSGLAPQYVVSTFAGSGAKGILNGLDTLADFDAPYDVTIDRSGNLYVSEIASNCIRKITPSGIVSTFAGAGIAGDSDAQGTSARFNSPAGITVDGAGNVYVADLGNNKIRKITPSGLVSTFSGNGISGLVDGPPSIAEYQRPIGVSVDANGNIYVTDSDNGYIRKISPDGMASSLVFIGTQNADGIDGIAVNGQGNVFVSAYNGETIFEVTPTAKLTKFAGNGINEFANGQDTLAEFSGPAGICADSHGNIYVTEVINNSIRMITASGVVTTLAGSVPGFNNGPASMAKFYGPRGVVADPVGNLYVADQQNCRVRKISIR